MNAIVKPEELIRAALANPSDDICRQILMSAGVSQAEIERSITTQTGLVAYDLQAPAKNLYPVYTPIRNKLPRVNGGTGVATNWKSVTGIQGSTYNATGWVPEGQRSARMSYTVENKAASYATIGEEDQATFEAINAGKGFEDIQARMTMRLLQKMMLKEEVALLGGNANLILGTPTTPTLSASGAGATLPALTYSVIVVALTMEGWLNSSLANGVATSTAVTGADGQTFTANGGSSMKSTAATQAVTLGQTLFASVAPVTGAVAYAWFTGAAGSEKLEAITFVNSAKFTAPLNGTRQAATAITADCSRNTRGFDGLLTTAFTTGNNAYVKTMATGTAGTGTALTASGAGGVVEIDDMLKAMWDNYQVAVSVIYVNSQELQNISKKVLTSSGGGSMLSYFKAPNGEEYRMTAGGQIEFYYNPFRINGTKIPILIHPNVPPGTIIGWAEDLPMQYQSNEVPNVAEVKVRQDYYQIDWPLKTRAREQGVYAEEVLAVYAPFAMGLITNIANG